MDGKALISRIKEGALDVLIPPIECWMENGAMRARAKGARGKLFQPLLDYSMGRLNKNKVIGRVNGANVYTLYNPPMPTPAGIRLLEGRLKEKFMSLVTPTTVTFAVTYACPCKCEFCSADRFSGPGHTHGRKILTTEEAKDAIDQAINIGCTTITFTGGEPLGRKDFLDLVAHVPREKAIAISFTSGYHLTDEKVAALKDAGIFALNVSIDSIIPERHNEFRRTPNLFKKAWKGAERLRDAGILVGISTHASHENIADGSLELLLTKSRDAGFNEVTIFDSMPTGKWIHHSEVILIPDERKKIVDMARKYVAMDGHMGVIAQSWINSPHGSGCFAGFFQFYMSAYGDVHPCDFHPISFGNIREKPLEELWDTILQHPEYKQRKWNCRMQSPEFRQRYIECIPEDSDLPVPVDYFGLHDKAAPDVPWEGAQHKGAGA